MPTTSRRQSTRHATKYCSEGLPDRSHIPALLHPYWPERSELTILQGLLMKGNRLVITVSMRLDVLDRIHEAHQGITKCRERAKASVWWPGLSKQLEEVVNNCSSSIKERVNVAEAAIPSDHRPWQKVAADLFELKGLLYLLVMDCFYRYVEVAKLSRMTSPDVAVHLKSMFARHGIPDQFLSDNGPQFSATAFAKSENSEERRSLTGVTLLKIHRDLPPGECVWLPYKKAEWSVEEHTSGDR